VYSFITLVSRARSFFFIFEIINKEYEIEEKLSRTIIELAVLPFTSIRIIREQTIQ